MSIPGVQLRTAEVIIAEIGSDMSVFPTAGHLASWAGLCPGNHSSAGKSTKGTTRPGSPWLQKALVEAALSASHSHSSYLAVRHARIRARRGSNVQLWPRRTSSWSRRGTCSPTGRLLPNSDLTITNATVTLKPRQEGFCAAWRRSATR